MTPPPRTPPAPWLSSIVVLTLWATTGMAGEAAEAVSVVLAPKRRAVLSAETPSRVLRVHHEMGDAFDAGAVLIELDATRYRLRLEEAKAALQRAQTRQRQAEALVEARIERRRAEAVLAAAESHLKSTRTLYEQKQLSRAELEAARRDVVLAKTDLERVDATQGPALAHAQAETAMAQAVLDRAANDVNHCTVRAPYAGRIVRVRVQAHERVEPGTPLVEILDDRALEARFLLPASVLPQATPGRTVPIRIRETGTTVPAKITRVSPQLDPASRTFEAVAAVDNTEGTLQAGMNGHLSLDALREE